MKKKMAGWARLGVLTTLLLGLGAGCWGDVEIVDEPVHSTAGTAGTTSTAPDTATEPLQTRCEESDVQCNGADLERCVSFGAGQANGWLKIQHCDSAALCNADSASCTAKTCAFGEQRCSGAVPERCNEDLTAREQLGSCANAAFCSPDADKCAAENKQAPCCLETACTGGELRCNNGQLERCRDDQMGLDPLATCATQKLCELSLGGCQSSPASCACEPPKCDAGATRCSGSTLERCNADQTDWETVDTCTTEELCQAGLALTEPACVTAPCEVGEHRCTDARLEVCNAGQTGFDVLVQACPGGAAFCDSGAGVCTETPCQVGDTRCNGAQIERCLPDRSGFVATPTVCATPQLCRLNQQRVAFCTPPACGPNEFQCQDSQPQRCNAARNGFTNAGPACARADLCDETRQRCDACVPSRRECTFDLRNSRTCSPDGSAFGPATFCPLGCIANTGACQTCTVGEFRCQGGLLQRCNDGISFAPLNVGAQCANGNQLSCNGNQLQTNPCGTLGCNAQRNACNQCAAPQRACADTRNALVCRADGTFAPPQPCGNGLLCAGAGQCACTPGQPSCNGDTLQVCNPTGDGLVAGARCSGASGNVLRTCAAGELTTNTCSTAALCAAATGASCAGCIEGERTCAAGQPQVCTNGQRVPAAACAAGFACEGAGLCRCAAGDVRCTAGALVQCSLDRTTLDPAATCAGSTLRACSGNTRAPDQDCGAPELCAAASAGVCASCLDTDPPTCADISSEVRCVGGQLQQNLCGTLGLCIDGVGCLL
jgi:hypothetical protein